MAFEIADGIALGVEPQHQPGETYSLTGRSLIMIDKASRAARQQLGLTDYYDTIPPGQERAAIDAFRDVFEQSAKDYGANPDNIAFNATESTVGPNSTPTTASLNIPQPRPPEAQPVTPSSTEKTSSTETGPATTAAISERTSQTERQKLRERLDQMNSNELLDELSRMLQELNELSKKPSPAKKQPMATPEQAASTRPQWQQETMNIMTHPAQWWNTIDTSPYRTVIKSRSERSPESRHKLLRRIGLGAAVFNIFAGGVNLFNYLRMTTGK